MKTNYFLLTLVIQIILVIGNPAGTDAQTGAPWIKTNVGFNYIFRGIDFPNNQGMIGYMAGESLTYNGNGIVIKTIDGGNTWVSKWTGVNMGIEGSCFIDENTGFIAGWPKLSNGWSGFGKTTNGGSTWTSPVVTTDVYYFTDVVFKDANNGIILGSTNTAPAVFYTSNSGTTWTAASGVSNGVPAHACHVSGNNYFLVDNGGRIKKSTDNGHTWSTVYTVPGGLLTGIDFYNENIGMACGDDGLIVITNDGGVSWQTQTYGTDIWHDFGWESQDHVFACGTPEIVAESTDGGATWGDGFPGSTYQAALYECIFTSTGAGFICGSQGTLLKRQASCIAGFSANQTSICRDSSVSFINQSTGNITGYHWYFEGGTPASSTEQNPVVTYHSTGTWDVALMVSDAYSSDSLLMPDYIMVSQPVAPVISVSGYLQLSSNIPSGNQWYHDDVLIPGETGQTLQVFIDGWYWDVVTENGCPSDTSNNIFVLVENIPDHGLNNLGIFQVPGDSRVRLKTAQPFTGPVDLSVYNSLGLKIYEALSIKIPVSGEAEIDLGQFTGGVYFFRVTTGNTQVVRKVLMRE